VSYREPWTTDPFPVGHLDRAALTALLKHADIFVSRAVSIVWSADGGGVNDVRIRPGRRVRSNRVNGRYHRKYVADNADAVIIDTYDVRR